jgi:glutathione S-transferase
LPAAPAERARVEQWMDWQATELNTAWRYAFMGLVRNSPEYADAAAIAKSARAWNDMMTLLDRQLDKSGAYATGAQLTLADIVLGLSTHRWLLTPIERPVLPAVAAYYERLCARPAFEPLRRFP